MQDEDRDRDRDVITDHHSGKREWRTAEPVITDHLSWEAENVPVLYPPPEVPISAQPSIIAILQNIK